MAEVTRTNTRVLTAETLTDLQALGSNDGIESNMVAYATNQNAWLRPSVINPSSSTWTTISGGASDLASVLTVGNDSGGSNIQMSGGGIITTSGQDLTLSASTSLVTTPGDLNVDGKLTVAGLIDPTGLLLNGQGAAPVSPTGNDGLLWVNTSGELVFDDVSSSLNITQALTSTSTAFVDAYTRMQWGFYGPAGNNTGVPFAGSGVWDSVSDTATGGSGVGRTEDADGPSVIMQNGPSSGDYIALFGDFATMERRQAGVFSFKVKNQDTDTAYECFIGLTSLTAATHAADMIPSAAGDYIGIGYENTGGFLRFAARNGSGSTFNNATTVAQNIGTAFHVIIDFRAGAGNTAVLSILDDDGETVLATTNLNASAPADGANLRPMVIFQNRAGVLRDWYFYGASGVVHADLIDAIAPGGGGGAASQSLAGVLTVGPATGGNNIIFTDGDQILGESVASPTPLIFQAGDASSGNGSGGDAGVLAGDGNGTGDGGNVINLAGAPQVGQGGDGGDVSLTATSGAASATVAGGLGGGIGLNWGDGGAATAGSGNGGLAQDATWSLGAGGASVGGVGGNGGGWTLVSGAGGAVSGGTGNGGTGGGLTVTGGAGGNSVGGAGGLANNIIIAGGNGGDATGGTGNGGAGSNIQFAAGNGGSSVGGTVGVGGNITFQVGSGSTNGQFFVNSAATNPVTITMQVVDPGTGNGNNYTILGATSPDADGGDITLTAGSSSAGGVGGDVNMNGGGGPDGGDVNLTGGGGTTSGGDILLTSGTNSGSGDSAIITMTGAGASDSAGAITIQGGDQTGTPATTASGGTVQISTGSGAINASGDATASGDIVIETVIGTNAVTGDGGNTGTLALATGIGGDGGSTSGSTGGDGGAMSIATGGGGDGGATNGNGGNGGDLLVGAGSGGSATGTGTQGDGGTLVLTAGPAGSGGAGGGTGGSVILVPGAGTLASGTIRLDGLVERDATGYKHGTIAAGAAVVTNPIVFGTAFPAGPPLTVNVTIEGPPAGPPPVHWIHTISGTGFTVEFAAAPGAGYVIHWSARQ